MRSVQEIAAAEILQGLPNRIHKVIDRHVIETPDRLALIEDGAALSYRELDGAVRQTADALATLGVRPGDRMMIVSENCIALACLLLAASRNDAWAIVVNPRLSPRELDQIGGHCRRLPVDADGQRQGAQHVGAEVGDDDRDLVARELDAGDMSRVRIELEHHPWPAIVELDLHITSRPHLDDLTVL